MQEGVPDIRQTPFTGPSNHVRQIFNELRNLGHQVRLLAAFDRKIMKSDDLENFSEVKIPIWNNVGLRILEKGIRRVQSELRLPYLALFNSFRFAAACHQELIGYNILYERMGWMGYGGNLASKLNHIPLILEVNGDHLNELKMLKMEPHGAQRWISIQLMGWAIRRASYSVTTGEGWRSSHIERWGVAPSRVSVIENGTELVRLLTRERLGCFRQEEVTNDITSLVYVGAIEPWNGIQILIRSISKVIHEGINVRLEIVGAGSLFDDIKRQVVELGLESCVHFSGNLAIKQVAEILSDADIGLSPYCGRTEYSGLKLLDYKAAGLATVVSGLNGEPKIIKHGRTGLIVPPCDEDQLKNAIVMLCSDVELRRKMGKEARIEAEELHDWSNSAKKLEEIFLTLLN